jgi:hypothetical protein
MVCERVGRRVDRRNGRIGGACGSSGHPSAGRLSTDAHRFDPRRGDPVPLGSRCGVDGCRVSTHMCPASQPPSRVSGAGRTAVRGLPPRAELVWGHTEAHRRCREQAHVPAEQPPSPQEARLPSADAHARGPRDPGRPSVQGSPAPGRLNRLRQPARRAARTAAAHPRRGLRPGDSSWGTRWS